VRIDLPAMNHVAARAPSGTIAQLNEDRLGTLSVAASVLTVIGTTSVEGNLAVGADVQCGRRRLGWRQPRSQRRDAGDERRCNKHRQCFGHQQRHNRFSSGRARPHRRGHQHGYCEADSGNVTIAGSLNDGGNAAISGTSQFEFGAASTESVTSARGASGTPARRLPGLQRPRLPGSPRRTLSTCATSILRRCRHRPSAATAPAARCM
jgi:hypothetical protein